jgi:hypothetical protein
MITFFSPAGGGRRVIVIWVWIGFCVAFDFILIFYAGD